MMRSYPFIASKHQKAFVEMMRSQIKHAVDGQLLSYFESTFSVTRFGRNFPIQISEDNTNNVSEAIFSVYSRSFSKVPSSFEFFSFLSWHMKTQIDFRNLRRQTQKERSLEYDRFMISISKEYQSDQLFENTICSIFKLENPKEEEFETDDEIADDVFTQMATRRSAFPRRSSRGKQDMSSQEMFWATRGKSEGRASAGHHSN